MAPFASKVIRALFGAAEHVAPAPRRQVRRSSCSAAPPTRARLSERERKAVERAAGFLAEARQHCLTTRTGRVMVLRVPSARRAGERPARCWSIHGWGSRTEHMKALIEGLRDAGYRVVSLDLPGHGASPGRRLTMVQRGRCGARRGRMVRSVRRDRRPFLRRRGRRQCRRRFGQGRPAARRRAPGADRRAELDAGDLQRFRAYAQSRPQIVAAPWPSQVERIAGRPLEDFVGSPRTRRDAGADAAHPCSGRSRGAGRSRADYAAAGEHVRLHGPTGSATAASSPIRAWRSSPCRSCRSRTSGLALPERPRPPAKGPSGNS